MARNSYRPSPPHVVAALSILASSFFHPSAVAAFSVKPTWKVFVDLQCPYARKAWNRLPELKKEFGDEYDFSMHLTSLAFHPQAFVGQQAAYLIGQKVGAEAKQEFIDACFTNQELYTNDGVGDARKSEVDNVFASIAERAGIFNQEFTQQEFLANLHDFTQVVKPAYAEHKVALGYGVFGTPKHVINEQLVPDTESTWGPEEWKAHLEKLQKQKA